MRWVATLVPMIALAGCRQLFGVDDTTVAPDAPRPDAGLLGPWGTPQRVSIPGTGPDHDDPSLTEDRLELYLNAFGEIWVSRRADLADAWSVPQLVTELSSSSDDSAPEVSADGLTMYLSTDRLGGVGLHDVWRATRAGRALPWTAPAAMPDLSGPDEDIVGGTDSTGDMLALSRIDTNHYNLYLAMRSDAAQPFVLSRVTGADTPASDHPGSISGDGQTIYFASNIGGGDMDIYTVSRGPGGLGFGMPAPIAELNTDAEDLDIWVSPDERHAMFYTNRDSELGLYESSR